MSAFSISPSASRQQVLDQLDQHIFGQQPELQTRQLRTAEFQTLLASYFDISSTASKPLELIFARLDVLHPDISGNKWPKLRDWFRQLPADVDCVGSMGGAHSNHLVAFAAVAKLLHLKCRCIVRANGLDRELQPTPTTARLAALGCDIEPVLRSEFRTWRQHSASWFLPEGGRSSGAVASVASWTQTHAHSWQGINTIACGVGTGTWLAGMNLGLALAKSEAQLLGVPAVAGQKWLAKDIEQLQSFDWNTRLKSRWSLDWSYPVRGFGPAQPTFVQALAALWQIPIDPVYMPRILYALIRRWCSGELTQPVLVVHGGGLQAAGSCWPRTL